MVIEIAPDIYKIRNFANVYLVMKPTPTLIDTGKRDNWDHVKKEIEKIISIDKIKRVILTHFHYDHSENLDMFVNAEVYASKEEIEDFKKSNGKYFHRGDFSKRSKEIIFKEIKPLPKKISGMDVVPVPGHTRGCVVFVDKKRRLIYTGDTLFCVMIGRTDMPNSVPEEMKFSLEKIMKLIDKYDLELCPGHDEF